MKIVRCFTLILFSLLILTSIGLAQFSTSAVNVLMSEGNFITYGYPQLKLDVNDTNIADTFVKSNLAINSIIDPEILGFFGNYPNPFVAKDGTSLGYRLSKDMEVGLKIYNMFGRQVFSETYTAGFTGGLAGYNKVSLPLTDLAVGVYFYTLTYQGKDGRVIKKSKMGVIK